MIEICGVKFSYYLFSYGKQSLRPSVSTDGFYFNLDRIQYNKYFM